MVSAKMKKTDKAYLAGIVDGEGWFGWSNSVGSRRTRNVKLTVTNNDEELMLWLMEKAGGSIHERSDKAERFGTELSYDWRISGSRAIIVLRAILPFMIIKADKARCICKEWDKSYSEMVMPHMRREAYARNFAVMREMGWC